VVTVIRKVWPAGNLIARVSNQSVTSIFKEFSVGLYINGKLSDEKKIKGLRGHSRLLLI